MRRILAEPIACPDTMALIDKILASGIGVLSEEYELVYFPGDDLLAALRPRGLPIGNLTSQFWSNCYLHPLDHFVKRELKCPAYLRYVDDMALFADDKRTLHHWRTEIISYLAALRLTIHEARAQPRPVSEGAPFLGFVVYPDHRRLKRSRKLAYQRRLKGLWAAYQAGWLTEQLRSAGQLAQDWVVRLPTEAEWEKAARGSNGRIYPWGDKITLEQANYDETGVGTTSAVGCFAGGASPYGCQDMAGNVWEWCATQWRSFDKPKPYPYDVTENEWTDEYLEGTNVRVLRGGAFYFDEDLARAAVRSRIIPNYRIIFFGFRVVRAPIGSES